jgi:hypothetical protein
MVNKLNIVFKSLLNKLSSIELLSLLQLLLSLALLLITIIQIVSEYFNHNNLIISDLTALQLIGSLSCAFFAKRPLSLLDIITITVVKLLFNQDLSLEDKFIVLANLVLSEDARSALGEQISRELRTGNLSHSKDMRIVYLFLDCLWGTTFIPYFENKFLPGKNQKEVD